jgi:ParB-like chromosome segregation protein Spo0J
VLAGNHRLMAARAAGLSQIPVMWVDVDDDRARRILLVDNRSNDIAGYDEERLAALLSELAVSEQELVGTGYDEAFLVSLSNKLAGGPLPTPGDAEHSDQPEVYGVIIECTDEDQQVELLARLTDEGLSVRALVG